MISDKRIQREKQLIENLNGAPIKHALGMSLWYDDEGCAVFDLPYNPDLNHAMGGVHGGVIGILLDNAGWFTVAALYDTWIATVEFNVRLLEPVEKEGIRARGRILRSGKSLCVAEMEARTTDGRLVAVGSGTYSVTSILFGSKQAPEADNA